MSTTTSVATETPSKKSLNRRALVTLLVATGFLAVAITGIMSYVLPWSATLGAVHTLVGMAMVGYAFFHIRNNWRPLTNYMKGRAIGDSGKKRRPELRWSLLVLTVLLFGALLKIPPFSTIIDLGYQIRNTEEVKKDSHHIVFTHADKHGRKITLDVRGGSQYLAPGAYTPFGRLNSNPQMVFWIEDMDGNYIDTLYITKKGGTNNFWNDNPFSDEIRHRPESLPYWSHRRNERSPDGSHLMPTRDNPVADGITAATPKGNFDLNSHIDQNLRQFRVLMEVNRSFDYNEYYHENAWPDDPVYSGSGNTAQPSLIYAAEVNLDTNFPHTFMKVLGHGHRSGQDGNLYTDLSNITTALEIVERVVVTVK